MIWGLKKIVTYALGTDIAGRNLAVYPDDTFVVSYPRSGNTWTRFLIANLVHPDKDASFANIESLIPDAEAMSSRFLKRVPRPRMIKSHQYFDHRYRKVIYVVRDPRDVALSYYDFSRKYRQIQDGYPVTSYVGDFVNGRLSSADWGTWAENVASWFYTRKGRPGFLLLRYEDMLSDTPRELARIAEFLGIEATPARLQRAIELSSADRMRGLEKQQAGEWVTTKDKRSDIPFVRTAAGGLWKEKLPRESVAQIETSWGTLMSHLGYQLTTVSTQPAPSPELVTSASETLSRNS